MSTDNLSNLLIQVRLSKRITLIASYEGDK